MTRRVVVGVAMLAVACASSSTGSGPPAETGCKDITGIYDVTATRVSGSCPRGDDVPDKVTVTIATTGGKPTVALPGIEGGCPGELDASTCKFTAFCKIFDTKTNKDLVLYNVDYTFAGKTLSGTIVGVQFPPLVAAQCDAVAKHEGTRL